MTTMKEYLEKALKDEVNEMRMKSDSMRLSLFDAPKQCQKCTYINSVDHYPSPGGEYFCEHDIFDNMPRNLSDDMTKWVFSLADKMKCPLFKKGFRRR